MKMTNRVHLRPRAVLGAVAIMLTGALSFGHARAAVAAPLEAPRALRADPTADEIVDKVIQARGGADAWRKITSLIWVGHIESERLNGQPMRFTLEEQLPGKRRFDITGNASSVRIFNGTKGWKVRGRNNSLPEVEPFTDLENQFELEAPDVGGPLISFHRQKRSIALLGHDTLDGHDCYVLGVTLPSGARQMVWVDMTTYLEQRLDRPSYSRDGKAGMVSMYYRNYRDQGGLQIPTLWEIGAGSASGMKPDRLVIERLGINPEIAATRFTQPPSPPHTHEITITPPMPSGMPH